MLCICKFNPKRDLGLVIDGLFPDIEDLIVNGKISDTASSVVYNELSDIKSVGVRVNDEFDAIMLSRAIKANIASNKGTGSSQQAGSSAPVMSAGNSGNTTPSE